MAEGATGRRLAGKIGAALWLMALYAVLTYLAVGTISVSQINSRFGDQAGYIFHIADIAEQQRAAWSAQVRVADGELYQAQVRREQALVGLSAEALRLGIPVPLLRTALDDPKVAVRLADFNVQADAETNRHWDDAVGEYYRQALQSELVTQRRDGLVADLRDGLNKLVANHTMDGKVMGSIPQSLFQTATSTAAGLRSFGYAWLFSIPPEVQTLVLALVLGALGSALHMTRIVIDGGESPPVSWYLFRPCQGVLMALVVFVLLKAGQLTVGAGDTDSLNPFFVAFVGTVSGLLATDAYRLVQRTGAALIPAGDDETDRWAFGLAAAMEAAGIDAPTLAAGIGVRPEEVAAWMAETRPVPELQQRVLSAWLRADPRRLFTMDQPRRIGALPSPQQTAAAQ